MFYNRYVSEQTLFDNALYLANLIHGFKTSRMRIFDTHSSKIQVSACYSQHLR